MVVIGWRCRCIASPVVQLCDVEGVQPLPTLASGNEVFEERRLVLEQHWGWGWGWGWGLGLGLGLEDDGWAWGWGVGWGACSWIYTSEKSEVGLMYVEGVGTCG